MGINKGYERECPFSGSNKKYNLKRVYFIFACILLSLGAAAQDFPDTVGFRPVFKKDFTYKIKTKAGTIHTGKVVRENLPTVTIINELTRDSLQLNKREIASFKQISKPVNNTKVPKEEDEDENHHAGNYMLASSAFETESGETVATGHWILLENLQYSFNENVSITTNILGINPISVGLKTQFRLKDRVFAGATGSAFGTIFSSTGSPAFFGYLGQAYVTFGTTNHNITAGAGVAGLKLNLISSLVTSTSVANFPFVSGAFCQRINRNFGVVGEGYYFLGTTSVIGGASVKIYSNDYNCWTLGLYTMINESNNSINVDLKNYFIPYLGIRRRFN